MKDKKIIVGFVVVALVLAGIFASSMNKNKDMPIANTQPTPDSSVPAADTSDAVTATDIMIKDYKFAPMTVKAKVGDTITWTNMDAVRHNVVADKVSADAPNGPLLMENETYKFKFTKAGTYAYHCNPHPYMKATIVVTN